VKPVSDNNREAQLLESFLNGDEHAFSSIYTMYVDELFAYGINLGFHRDILKDAIQDIFCKLYFDKKNLRTVRNLKYYLFSIYRNRLVDIYRATKDTTDIDSYEMSFTVKSTILDVMIGEEEKKVVRNQIDLLLERLTSRQREAVYLRFIEELEYEEIGNLLNMTPPAVRKLISRAIKRMRE